MRWWFGKKKQPETSPGGSVIQRYSNLSETPTGFTDESTAEFFDLREGVYERFFGEAESVYHEEVPLVPHIDIYIFEPGHGRNY